MMAHELLRQAALILAQGWSKGCDARDDTGRMVPLYIGASRANINPEATAFSPYGAICKAASQDHPICKAAQSGSPAPAHCATIFRGARGGGINALSGMSDLLSGRRPDSLNVGHFPGAKP